MEQSKVFAGLRRMCRVTGYAAMTMLGAAALSGCLVAGYSSRGGFFVWPGSIVITLVVLLVLFLLRRGR